MKIAPLVFALALVAATLWRWSQLGWALRAIAAGVVTVLSLYGAGVVVFPRLEDVALWIGATLGPYTYLLIAVMAFVETGALLGLLAPGEAVVIIGGVVAGQGHIELWLLLLITWLCAFAGDLNGFWLGRRLGRSYLERHGASVHLTPAHLRRVETFFTRHGPATILVGRFVGFVRPLAPFLAGASSYPRSRFAALAGVSTALWSATFVLLGYFGWQSVDEILRIARRVSIVLAVVVAVAALSLVGYRVLRDRSRRRRPGPRPAA